MRFFFGIVGDRVVVVRVLFRRLLREIAGFGSHRKFGFRAETSWKLNRQPRHDRVSPLPTFRPVSSRINTLENKIPSTLFYRPEEPSRFSFFRSFRQTSGANRRFPFFNFSSLSSIYRLVFYFLQSLSFSFVEILFVDRLRIFRRIHNFENTNRQVERSRQEIVLTIGYCKRHCTSNVFMFLRSTCNSVQFCTFK